MHPLLDKAQNYARKSVADKLNETVESTLNKIPDVPIVSPMVKKVATEATKHANKKLRKSSSDVDVLIIGAGVSGILMASKLKKTRPLDSMLIVEKRAAVGGTWDLFNYPGVRSDSDITTFCFANRPWYGTDTLADGSDIKSYIQQTVKETGIEKNIQFNTVVRELNWSSTDQMWSVQIKNLQSKQTDTITAKFVVGASGYYNMDKGYQPEFSGQETFQGQIVHPQKWQDNVDYHDKNVVIIGSGATAVTLLPALLDKTLSQQANKVTMLQRTPSYIVSVPSQTDFAEKLYKDWKVLSKNNAYQLNRWRAILTQQLSYKALKNNPRLGKGLLTMATKKELAGTDISLHHFVPAYNPWDQRVCATPDGEFFKALRSNKAQVITDSIHAFTKNGIQLTSGEHLPADIIVTATGLNIQMLGGATLRVDDEVVTVGDKMTYKAVMLEDIPNMAVLFGYTNASWTLKIDLATDYIIRMLKYMQSNKYKTVKADSNGFSDDIRQADNVMSALDSGYVHRGADLLPKQGNRYPWLVTNDFFSDRKVFTKSKLTDEWVKFS